MKQNHRNKDNTQKSNVTDKKRWMQTNKHKQKNIRKDRQTNKCRKRERERWSFDKHAMCQVFLPAKLSRGKSGLAQKSGSDIFHCHATATYEKYSFIFLHFTYVKVASAVVVVPIVLTSYV